jgi:hypothetical protein
MNRRCKLAVIGVIGATALVSGCWQEERVKELESEKALLREFLKKGGPLYSWLDALSESVCELEQHVPGLDQQYQHCKGHGPGDKTPPPAYPPAP